MNKKRGSLLMEINLLFMLMGILFAAFYQSFLQMLVSAAHIQEDIELYRVSRLLFATVGCELTYNTKELTLGANEWGDILLLKHIGPKRQTSFYCRTTPQNDELIGFYQSIKSEGKSEGINPLSPPTVVVAGWQGERLDAHTIKLTLELATTQSGRKKVFTDSFRLSNGTVL